MYKIKIFTIAAIALLANSVAYPMSKKQDPEYRLLLGSRDGNLEMVQQAIKEIIDEHPDDPNLYPDRSVFWINQVKNQHSVTPLMFASRGGHINIVKYLINVKVNVNAKDYYGQTALICARNKNHSEIAKLLVEAGAQEQYPTDKLLTGARSDSLDLVKEALKEGADINAHDKNHGDYTALMYAAWRGHTSIVKYLVDNKANVNETIKSPGRYIGHEDYTAIMLTKGKNRTEIVKLLLDAGAEPEPTKNKFIRGIRQNSFQLVEEALKEGFDINSDISCFGNNFLGDFGFAKHALSVSIDKDNIELVRFLIKNGADVNKKDTKNSTPLMVASSEGVANIVNILLEAGADINAQDDRGFTALMYAAFRNEIEAAIALLTAGADMHVKNAAGRTAIDKARERSHEGMVEILQAWPIIAKDKQKELCAQIKIADILPESGLHQIIAEYVASGQEIVSQEESKELAEAEIQ